MLDAPNNSFQKIIELNAGAALYVAGLVDNLKDGFALSKQTINSYKSKNYFVKRKCSCKEYECRHVLFKSKKIYGGIKKISKGC